MAEKESADESLKVSEEAVKTVEEAQVVATHTATNVTAALATITAERDNLRDSADDNMSMRENAENDLAAARAISTQLRPYLSAKEEELTAARMSFPADVAALKAPLDFMTQARDNSVEDARVGRTSLSDAEAPLVVGHAFCFHCCVASSRGCVEG